MDEVHPLNLWETSICRPSVVHCIFKTSAYHVMGGMGSPRYLFQVMMIHISWYTVNAIKYIGLFKTGNPLCILDGKYIWDINPTYWSRHFWVHGKQFPLLSQSWHFLSQRWPHSNCFPHTDWHSTWMSWFLSLLAKWGTYALIRSFSLPN